MKWTNFFTVRKILSFCLLCSIIYAAYSIHYKVKYWGFSLTPKDVTDVWRIDAKISFKPISNKVKVALTIPDKNENFNILSEEVIAEGYDVTQDNENHRIEFEGKNKKGKQNIYYRLNIYEDLRNSQINQDKPQKVDRPILSEEERQQIRKIWELSEIQKGNKVQRIILTVNKEMANPSMSLVLPIKHTKKEFAEKIIQILAYKHIPARIARAIKK